MEDGPFGPPNVLECVVCSENNAAISNTLIAKQRVFIDTVNWSIGFCQVYTLDTNIEALSHIVIDAGVELTSGTGNTSEPKRVKHITSPWKIVRSVRTPPCVAGSR